MALDCDQEILQDFLIEAGEILEQLSEQLVELESKPDDYDLLNAIFRGFHTVKGGAGFLSLTSMVDICHVSENVFDILRNQQRNVDADLMDVVLKALDEVNAMFEQVRAQEEPSPAEPELLEQLGVLAKPPAEGESAEVIAEPEPEPEPEPETKPADSASEDITDDEFEDLLDSLHGSGGAPKGPVDEPSEKSEKAEAKAPSTDEITDDEFEALLDSLHGDKAPGVVDEEKAKSAEPEVAAEAKPEAPKPAPAAKPSEPPKAAAEPKPQAKPQPAKKPPAKKGDAPTGTPQETTVRVDTSRLDDIMNMVGELVLVRNRLVTLGTTTSDERITQAVSNLDVVTADLQMSVMKTRMQPIKKVFGRFPRVVRDLARTLKKEITLELVGEETDLDKNLVDALADPLVHLVRNSVDHGVEMPDVRVENGKDKMGTVILAAEQAGDHILLSIKDDGGGMNANKLRDIAVSKGLMDQEQANRLSDKEAFNLIFMPGFSTKEQISDISGRGVGMDVVKTKITQLNGSIEIDSVPGKGTTISIKVPLTLAILPTLMIALADQIFALPLTNVNEIFHLDLTHTNIVDGQLVVVVRNKAIPLFYLKKWLVEGAIVEEKMHDAHVVIVTVGTQKVGFVVDKLIGQEEVVIKALGNVLHGTPGMAGATITGDGNIAMILDIPNLIKRYAAH